MFTLSKSELEVMSLLWKENRTLSKSEILNLSTEKSWKPSSIHILLNSLLNKEAIQVDGFVRTGKNYGRTYSATISQEEYAAMQFAKSTPEKSVTKKNLPGLFAALIHTDEIDSQVLGELQEILEKRKKEFPE